MKNPVPDKFNLKIAMIMLLQEWRRDDYALFNKLEEEWD